MSEQMSEKNSDYGILVAVDGSAESEAAIRWAAGEAVLRGQHMTLLHVVEPVIVTWPAAPLQASITEWQEENARHVVERAEKTAFASVPEGKPPTVHTLVRYAPVTEELIEASKSATTVVVGSRGLGAVGRAVLGSVSTAMLYRSHCPVAVVHADDARPSDRGLPVLLGIDGSPASEKATAFAFDEASRRGVDLIALHAWSDVGVFPILGMDWHAYEDEGHAILGERLAGWQEQYPDVKVHRRIVCDQPARWLIEESEEAQLVVLGSRGRGGFASMLLGSVSAKVARGAKAPVLVMRD